MKKGIILFFACCCFAFSYSQKSVKVSLYHDARLLLVGDDKGNNAITPNFLLKTEISIKKFSNSYLLAYPSIEYADLVGKNFKRYSLGAGYVVKSVYGKIGAGAYVDFGKIYRESEGFNSFSVSGELNYKINDKLKFICTQQLTYRKDLKVLYNSSNPYVISGFIGLKYSL